VQLRKPFLLEIIAYNLNSERLEVLISVRTQLTQCALKFGRGKNHLQLLICTKVMMFLQD